LIGAEQADFARKTGTGWFRGHPGMALASYPGSPKAFRSVSAPGVRRNAAGAAITVMPASD
jgi:hypothetical protein